jgi:two-component sensor histidine kinase
VTFPEPARAKTALVGESLRHLQRLVTAWQPLADLCFSDLVLLVPVEGETRSRFVVLAHVRPTTGQTVYPMDLVGTIVEPDERLLAARALDKGELVEGDATALRGRQRVRVQCVPVRAPDGVIAVLTRDARATLGRQLGELEDYYLKAFDRFAHMIADGTFPFAHDDVESEDAPRVGDGVIVTDPELLVHFASPNAVSALHRMGVHSYTSGLRLDEMGLDPTVVQDALRLHVPVTREIERGDASVLVQAIPMLERGRPVRALLLVRDVTDLRRRDRMLVSKDATIREIHHRVKNNLQTIAALLRLQGRRLRSGEAQAAIEESERRIRAIAIVHETLSRDAGDVVALDDIVRPLVRVVEESVSSPDRSLCFEVVGDAGSVPGDLATPLAVVLNELMQNAVDHAFPRTGVETAVGHVRISFARDDGRLVVDVTDDGAGLPPTFSMEGSAGLGLSIVQALVTTELRGTIRLEADGGTRAHLEIPIRARSA